MSHQYFGFWQNSRRLTSLVVGAVFLISALPGYAQFKPRDRKPASGYSRAGGSRGCSSSGIPMTQLAPVTFIGKTVSTRPMLAWYMSSSQTVRFRIFEFVSATTVKQIGKVKEIPTTIGINKLKLPLDYPELAVGKTYFWQIAIDCEARPVVSNAEFTVINPQLLARNRFTSIPESINYYAENELWYEAFEEALKGSSNGKLDQTRATLIKELAQSEIPTGSKVDIKIIQQRIEDIQRIISAKI
ncbi:DUF928 domain-containing protein [Nostoc sphaeroides CHAB 2801]|uniref:DUF928 domain-containing protein n=1 Tax=Nostoc sphaeroides TaxID=446679 RepID=UPI001E496D80|nr:DUF928 domain-containing protein [Nostoc sphaeroides]MCC5632325.1 DUF928 domain-containing protein [Nostoc sphaeroides CHAB 2801]